MGQTDARTFDRIICGRRQQFSVSFLIFSRLWPPPSLSASVCHRHVCVCLDQAVPPVIGTSTPSFVPVVYGCLHTHVSADIHIGYFPTIITIGRCCYSYKTTLFICCGVSGMQWLQLLINALANKAVNTESISSLAFYCVIITKIIVNYCCRFAS